MLTTEFIIEFLMTPQFLWFWLTTVSAFGLCVGSFLNVCIWRMPRDIPLAYPPSRCPNCDHKILWHENLPLVSWFWLQGRCAGCHQKISLIYPTVEILTALLFASIWMRMVELHGPPAMFLPNALITGVLIATIFIDAKHFIIPDRLTFVGMAVGLVLAALFPSVWGVKSHFMALWKSMAGLLFGGGMMAVAAVAGRLIFRQDALGWGDVKLMGAIGACLGSAACLFTVFVGSLLGSVVGLGMIIAGRGRLKTAIPFGPFLALACFTWMFYGPELTKAYFRWSNHFFKQMLGVG